MKSNKTNWLGQAEYRIKNRWLNYSSQIARRILAAIEDREDWNQTKLAELLQVSPQQISKIVAGRENLTLETIYKLSDTLQVDLISFPAYKYSAQQMPVQLQQNNNETFTVTEKAKHSSGLFPIQGGLYLDKTNTKYYGGVHNK